MDKIDEFGKYTKYFTSEYKKVGVEKRLGLNEYTKAKAAVFSADKGSDEYNKAVADLRMIRSVKYPTTKVCYEQIEKCYKISKSFQASLDQAKDIKDIEDAKQTFVNIYAKKTRDLILRKSFDPAIITAEPNSKYLNEIMFDGNTPTEVKSHITATINIIDTTDLSLDIQNKLVSIVKVPPKNKN